jgi:hypothetical protein
MICWSCGQRLEDVHQLSNVRLIGICLFGRCPKCGKDVPCRELIRIKKVIDLTGRNNDRRTRKNDGQSVHVVNTGNTGTSIQGRNPEQKQDAGMGSKTMDLKVCLVINRTARHSNIRERIPEMAVRDRTQKESKNGTK